MKRTPKKVTPKKATERLLSLSEYAKHRGVNPSSVTRWHKRGLLVMSGGKVNAKASDAQIDAGAGEESVFEAQARKERALADLRELERDEKRGRLIDADLVAKRWAEHGRRVRDGILTVPDRIAHALASESDARKVRAALHAALVQELEGLADGIANAR